MNKRLFINAFFLIPLCLIIGQSYACPTLRAIISDPDPKFFGKEMPAGFYGGSSIGSISLCTWSGPSSAGPYDVEFVSHHYLNDEIKCKFHNPGAYLITLIVTDEENPNRTDDANCVFYVMEAILNIDGVDDDDEENPGGYVSLNDDDDNDNGTPDKDEDGTVSGEDNLVEIYLSVSPSLSTGTMTLAFDKGAYTGLRVWNSPTKGDVNMIIPNGDPPCYYKDWPVQSMPTTLYVEGISTSSPRFDELWLAYKRDAATIHTDIVKFTVLEVELFRDSSYSLVLDDWPEDGDLLRSPKYIFGENDPIYVQVDNLGTDPQIAETIYDFVKVTSESGGLIYLDLKETGVNTQVFRNNSVVNDQLQLLYLDEESSSSAQGQKIKVIDEEELTFWLEIQPDSDNYVTCKTVMVDRGEFLAIAGSETSELSNWLTTSVPYFNQNISGAKSKMQNNYKWWKNGYMQGFYYSHNVYGTSAQDYESSKLIALNAGANLYFSCADFLFCSSHGDSGWLVIILTETKGYVIWEPEPTSGGGWASDAEFCIFSACQVLGTSADPDLLVNDWINNFFPKGLHAVLATSDEVVNEAIDDDFGGFLDRLKNGETAVNAYKNACYGTLFDTRYGILVREENLNDYILTPVAGAAATITRDYTTTDNTFYYFYYDGNQQIINPAQDGQNIPASERYYAIERKIAEAMEFKEETHIDVLSLDEKEQALSIPDNVRSLFEHTHMEKFSFSGWNKIEDANMVRHNTKIPEVSDRIYLESLGLEIPSDYVLDSRGKMMVSKYISNPGGMHQLGETWCEGETFGFIREYNGHKIFDDRFRVAIQNNNIISYILTRHPIKKTGTSIVKKPHFISKDSSIKIDGLHPSLVYIVKGNTVVPFWQLQYDNYLFHYDVEKVSNMR